MFLPPSTTNLRVGKPESRLGQCSTVIFKCRLLETSKLEIPRSSHQPQEEARTSFGRLRDISGQGQLSTSSRSRCVRKPRLLVNAANRDHGNYAEHSASENRGMPNFRKGPSKSPCFSQGAISDIWMFRRSNPTLPRLFCLAT